MEITFDGERLPQDVDCEKKHGRLLDNYENQLCSKIISEGTTINDLERTPLSLNRPRGRRRRASNSFFLLGSLLYFGIAIWDLHRDRAEKTDDAPHLPKAIIEYRETDEIDAVKIAIVFSPYTAIAGLAALCYVFDAMVQILSLPSAQESSHHLLHGFRRIPLLEFTVGLTFGVSAILDGMAVMTKGVSDSELSAHLAMAAVHVYLLNAILLAAGKQYACRTLSHGLEATGDALFVTGSIIDVILAYVFRSQDTLVVDKSYIVSTALWLVDSLLYTISGCCSSEEDVSEDIFDEELSLALCSTASATESDNEDIDDCKSTDSNPVYNRQQRARSLDDMDEEFVCTLRNCSSDSDLRDLAIRDCIAL